MQVHGKAISIILLILLSFSSSKVINSVSSLLWSKKLYGKFIDISTKGSYAYAYSDHGFLYKISMENGIIENTKNYIVPEKDIKLIIQEHGKF